MDVAQEEGSTNMKNMVQVRGANQYINIFVCGFRCAVRQKGKAPPPSNAKFLSLIKSPKGGHRNLNPKFKPNGKSQKWKREGNGVSALALSRWCSHNHVKNMGAKKAPKQVQTIMFGKGI